MKNFITPFTHVWPLYKPVLVLLLFLISYCQAMAQCALTITPSTSSPVCQGVPVQLTASGGTTYSWLNATHLNSSTDAIVTATPPVSWTFTVVSNGCTATYHLPLAAEFRFSNANNPNGLFAPDVTVHLCRNNQRSYVINSSSSLDQFSQFTWSQDFGWMPGADLVTSANGDAATFTPSSNSNSPGGDSQQSFTVSAVGINSGCTVTMPIVFMVRDEPTLTVNPLIYQICEGEAVNITANSTFPMAGWPSNGMRWWINDINTPLTNSSTINIATTTVNQTTTSVLTASPAASTNYTVHGGSVGCQSNHEIVSVIVNPVPNAPIISGGCINGAFELTAMECETYSWVGPGISNPSSPTITVSPTVQTTYTVYNVTASGCSAFATYTITQADIDCCHPYFVIPGYFSMGNSPALGYPSGLTTIDASYYGGSVEFSGSYHIKGRLKLTGGRFKLMPGTKFYVDAFSDWVDPVCTNFASFQPNLHLNYIHVDGDGTEFEMEGATITTNCYHMWEGIRLTGGASIITKSDGFNKSEISDAICAIKSYDGADCIENNYNMFQLSETEFIRCYSGLIDYNKETAQDLEHITDCSFNATGMLPPYAGQRGFAGVFLYADINVPLPGDYNLCTFNGNHFEYFRRTGFGGQGHYVHLDNNTFTNNFVAAIDIANDMNVVHNNIYVRDNIINLPNDPADLNMVSIGIRSYENILITGNTINGVFPAMGGHPEPQVGIYAVGEPTMIGFPGHTPNLFNDLHVGVKTEVYGPKNIIENNLFTDNAKAVLVSANFAGIQELYIRCNTMITTGTWLGVTATAIEVETGAGIVDQGDCNTNVNSIHPTGNRFSFAGTPQTDYLHLLGNGSAFRYNHALNEGTIEAQGSAFPLPCAASVSSDCSGLSNTHGVRVMGTSQQAIYEMMDSLRLQVGSFQDMAYYESKIIEYHTDNQLMPALAVYTATLAAHNLNAYNNLGLYLMRYYRKSGNEAAAQLMRGQLLANNLLNVDMEYEIKHFDVQGRMGRLLIGNGVTLAPQDSAALADIAASGTVHWYEACLAMRYYHPQTVCTAGSGNRSLQQAPKAAIGSALGNAYPNPAAATVTIPYQLAKGSGSAMLQLAEVATGRTVSQLTLGLKTEQVQLELDHIRPGLYVYTLIVDGVPVATKKLVIIK